MASWRLQAERRTAQWEKGISSGGYVQNWRATRNGLEGLAVLHSDMAVYGAVHWGEGGVGKDR